MKMLAAVSRQGAKAPVIETVDLEAPREKEILVRIVATGVCHTDLSVHEDRAPGPIVLGHEGAGVVERVGSGIDRFKAGDHVVMSYSYCGSCPSCAQGHLSYCYEVMPRNFGGLRLDGTSPISQNGKPIFGNFFGQSSFAQYAIVQEASAVAVTKEVPLEILGPLGCGILTGAGSVINSFKLAPGESIAVFGTGGVGLSAVMAARLSGASRIIAIDVVPSRLETAQALGATDLIDARDDDTAQRIKDLMPYGVNFSFNTTRSGEVAGQAIECLANRGTAGFVAPPDTNWSPNIGELFGHGRRLMPILMGDARISTFVPMLIDFYRQGRFPFDRLVKYFPFEKIADAFEESHSGSAIKPILRMPS